MDPLTWPGTAAAWWSANPWVGRSIGIVVLWAATLVFVRYNGRLFRMLDARVKAFQLNERTLYHMDRLIDTFAVTIALLLTLGLLGVTGALYGALTALGVVGIIIGFSAQDLVKNVFAGFVILVERPFMPGDAIEIAGHGGVVNRVSLRSTVLTKWDGREVTLPNSTFIANSVVNFSTNPTRRVEAPVAILHEADADRAMNVLREVATSDPDRVPDTSVLVRVTQVRESAIVLELWYWVPSASIFSSTTRAFLEVTKRFRGAGIELAVPMQRTLVSGAPLTVTGESGEHVPVA